MQMLLGRLKDILESATYGNSALKTLIDTLQTGVTTLLTDTGILKSRVTGNTKVHPTLAAHVVVTGGAGANALGAAAEIVAASAIAAAYYVNAVNVTATSGAGIFELVLYHGASDTEFARIQFITTGRFTLQQMKQIPANDKITAKVASLAGGAQTATASISYHQ